MPHLLTSGTVAVLFVVESVLCSPLSVRHATYQVKQTACLCLVKLIRVDPKVINHNEYSSRFIQLLNDKHLVSCLPTYVCSYPCVYSTYVCIYSIFSLYIRLYSMYCRFPYIRTYVRKYCTYVCQYVLLTQVCMYVRMYVYTYVHII